MHFNIENEFEMTWQLTDEIEKKIITNLENGVSLVKISQMEGMPSRSTVLRWQRDNKDFDAKCARAREASGEYAADKLDDINDAVLHGKLDPQAANVISSNLKWIASKLASKKYGEKIDVNGNIDVNHKLSDRLESAMIDVTPKPLLPND